jgi:hypothetical protein
VMAQKSDNLAAQKVTVQATQQSEAVRHVEQIGKTDKARLNKVETHGQNGLDEKGVTSITAKKEASKTVNAISQVMKGLEDGQLKMDAFIKRGMAGRLTNQELITLQAQCYQYTQELELTGKVVEKATTGLKDTLKTQV